LISCNNGTTSHPPIERRRRPPEEEEEAENEQDALPQASRGTSKVIAKGGLGVLVPIDSRPPLVLAGKCIV
jgi:hypothetical protein